MVVAGIPNQTERLMEVPPKKRMPIKFRADRLAELMRDRNVKQEDLASRIQVDRSQVSRWLSGVNDPQSTAVVAMANYFGVTADYLLGRVDDNVAYYKMPELTPDEWEFLLSIREGSFADALAKLAEEMKKHDSKPPKEGSEKNQVSRS